MTITIEELIFNTIFLILLTGLAEAIIKLLWKISKENRVV